MKRPVPRLRAIRSPMSASTPRSSSSFRRVPRVGRRSDSCSGQAESPRRRSSPRVRQASGVLRLRAFDVPAGPAGPCEVRYDQPLTQLGSTRSTGAGTRRARTATLCGASASFRGWAGLSHPDTAIARSGPSPEVGRMSPAQLLRPARLRAATAPADRPPVGVELASRR